jgi:hypothetical protein
MEVRGWAAIGDSLNHRSFPMPNSPTGKIEADTSRDILESLAASEYSYVSRNLIPHYKIETNVRFRGKDIAEWLRRHTA